MGWSKDYIVRRLMNAGFAIGYVFTSDCDGTMRAAVGDDGRIQISIVGTIPWSTEEMAYRLSRATGVVWEASEVIYLPPKDGPVRLYIGVRFSSVLSA